MRLGIFLALVATSLALDCNVGTLVLQKGVILAKDLKNQPCAGMCSRSVISGQKDLVYLSCQENEVAMWKYQQEERVECSATATELETSTCLCSSSLCSDIHAEEKLVEVPPSNLDVGMPTCYVGYYANNGTTGAAGIIVNNGATTNCGQGQACASINGTLGNTRIEAYLCTTQATCLAAISTTDGSGTINGDNIGMTCCTQSSCTSIVRNPDITVPTTITTGNNSIQCKYGAQLNYAPLGAINSLPCSGSCSSVSIKTYIGSGRNTQIALLDMFTCDPVSVCQAANLNNGCGNIVMNATSSLLRGCCCTTDNCIDPTTPIPTYPQRQLKCWTGILIRGGGFNAGAEVICAGKCSRFEVPVGTVNGNITNVVYMTCTPYSICAGLGIGDGDQSYNPPMEEETTITCCSSKDNCNISPYDTVTPNITDIPTTNYPILCYSGVHLNGAPIATGSYSMCNGECAMASFQTVAFGQTHNTTIYTCDPVSLCKSLGAVNGCNTVPGTNVNACCCDDDTCFDPNRQSRGATKCYTGIYVTGKDLVGGETLCNGWCASLSTIVNGQNSTTYWCAPVRVCRSLALGMGGDNNCQTLAGSNNALTGCCCAEGNNCNLPAQFQATVAPLPARSDPPIICYEAIYINGVPQGYPGYRVCNGQCVSMTMGDKINGSAQSTTLYTCDSSYACSAYKLANTCGSVDGTVYTCCCDYDACIDPTANRSPDRSLKCYVGVQSPLLSAGAEMACNGRCANMTTSVGGVAFTSYHCLPNSMCRAMSLDNSCDVIQLDRAITGCCCDSSDNCNTLGTNLNTSIPVAPPSQPIACWNGIHINHTTWVGGAGWQTCFGDCMVINLNTTVNGGFIDAAIYTCDPTTVCTSLNITNRCNRLEPGVQGCCCSDSGCIDPTANPPKLPGFRVTCFNGVQSGFNNLTAGAEQPCDGSCASLSSTVNGQKFTAFSCVPTTICQQFGLYDSCTTIQADRAITGCCCNNANNCNIVGFNVTIPRGPPVHDFPIVCFQGVFINNRAIAWGGYQACQGDCALVAFNTTYNGMRQEAEWYTCDPSSVCHQLNVYNRCHEVEPGVQGCCCDTDACLDPLRVPPKKPGPPLKCYVGVKSTRGLTVGVDTGAEVFCDGMCGNIHGLSGSYNVSVFFCAPRNLCGSLGLDNAQRQLPGDRQLTGLCCDTRDNCNVQDPRINTTRPVNPPEYPITCYSGIFLNRERITDGGWTVCNGQCTVISLNTTNNGQSIIADLYTCDPSTVCTGLGLQNSCGMLEDGLTGCCCDSNGCLDPTKRPPKRPGQLNCLAGFQSFSYNISAMASIPCNGKCASLSGNINGAQVIAYACVDSSICRGLNLDDRCEGVPGDREVMACCCDNFSYCNRRYENTTIPAPNPNTEYPISCWNSINLNGADLTPGRWAVCNGDCASLQLNTSFQGQQHSLTLYTCDPSSVCAQLKTRNTCNNIEPGVYACCCDTDECINPNKNKSPANPLSCYVGVKSNYNSAFSSGVGATVYCTGKCASLQGTVGGYNTTTFHCVDSSICKALQLDQACGSLSNRDREVQACCCDNGPACNVAQANVSMYIPPVQNSTEGYIACYSGIWLNGGRITPGTYQACQGSCASVNINTQVGNFNHSATLYTCDPSNVCTSLNTTNGCGILEPGLKGCCCNTDACIDPTKNRSPDISLWCYVGVYNGANNVSIGDSVLCDGGRKCMSISTTFNSATYKVYQCVAPNICKGAGVDNSCISPLADRDITACCCDNSPNCNALADPVGSNPLKLNYTGAPIACWSGLYLNGAALGVPSWSSCNGDCVAIQLVTSFTGVQNNATLYTCDPATVCQQLNIVNTCGQLDNVPGLTGCCCSTDACMSGNSITPKNQQMNCFAGIQSNFSTNPNQLLAGASVLCNGRCASLKTTVAGYAVTAYQCIATSVCSALGIDGSCSSLYYDRDITGCCCSDKDYCNIAGTGLFPPPTPNYTEPVIACYNGLWVANGTTKPWTVGGGSYLGCNGKCSSIALSTTLSGMNVTATLYTCDPSQVCNQLNLTNSCASPEPGVTGCCCDTDACLDPNFNRGPGRGLQCYVGVYNGNNGVSIGAFTSCPGKCGSVQTYINNRKTKAYFCLNRNQIEALGVDNGCRSIPADREVRACVCDDSNNCNVLPDEPVMPNAPNTSFSGNPVACWNGIYVNGNALGQVGWSGCKGLCAGIQWQTTLNGNNHTLTMYTCDPAAVCQQLNIVNQCGQLDQIPGLTGCCCNTDACMDASTMSIQPKSSSMYCFAGIQSTFSTQPNGLLAGASVKCNGRCATLTTTVAGYNVTAYQCIDRGICSTLGIDGTCGNLYYDRDIRGCCCNTGDYCNLIGTGLVIPPTPNYTEPVIACYNGLWVQNGTNGVNSPVAAGSYSGCQGKCSSISISTTLTGRNVTATLYTCDPSRVCNQLNLTNTCASPEPGIVGCCCDSDACLDPNYNRTPIRTQTCYVGVYNQATGNSTGADTTCDGKCGSVMTYINNKRMKAYFCLNRNNAEALGVDNGCRSIPADREVVACVCDNADNCNVAADEPVLQNAPNTNYSGNPIACWNGISMNGMAYGRNTWTGCNGQCAAIQLTTTLNTLNHTLVLYTCDPAAACTAMGLSNSCANVDGVTGLTGCCCNFDACIDATSIYPKQNPNGGNNGNNGGNTGGGATSLPYLLVMVFTAVYTLLRQS